jgi:hypothetical protein
MPNTITIAQGIGFSFAPVALCVTQKRVIVACKQAFELLSRATYQSKSSPWWACLKWALR